MKTTSCGHSRYVAVALMCHVATTTGWAAPAPSGGAHPDLAQSLRDSIAQLQAQRETTIRQIKWLDENIEHLRTLCHPPAGRETYPLTDQVPILLSQAGLESMAHSMALGELLADQPSAEARRWERIARNNGWKPLPADSPEFWRRVITYRCAEARITSKRLLESAQMRQQRNYENLGRITQQMEHSETMPDRTARPLPKPAGSVTPPAWTYTDADARESMRRTQELMNASSGPFMKTPKPSGAVRPPAPPAQPGREKVNTKIGEELDKDLKKMDSIFKGTGAGK